MSHAPRSLSTFSPPSTTFQNSLPPQPPPPPPPPLGNNNTYPPDPPPPFDATQFSQFEPPHIQQLHRQQLIQQHHNIDYERGGGSGMYRDLSIYPDPTPDIRRNRGGVTVPFPEKLHQMLQYAEKNDLTEIVSFFTHGRAFAIHKPVQFVADIMPKFFKQSRFTSFQRQVNLYGFQRLSQGPDSGGYYHELFLKGRPGLCINMKRTKVKGSTKSKSEPDNEPNFYQMPPILKNSEASARMERLFPTLTANAKSLSMPAPPSLSSFGSASASGRGSSGSGRDVNKSDDVMMKAYAGNSQHDTFVSQGGNFLTPAGLPNPQANQGKTLVGAPASFDMGNKTSDMWSRSNAAVKAQQSFNNPDNQLTASNMYNQGGLDLNYINSMAMNDFQNQLSIPDAMNMQHSTNFENPNFLNPGFSNQAVPFMHSMNRNMNLSQSFKKNDGMNTMGMLGPHSDGSLGLGSNTLAFNASMTGHSSAPLNYSVPPPSAMPMNTHLMQGKDQSSIANFNNPNFGTAASLSQSMAPANAFLGHHTGLSSGIGSSLGMQSAEYAMNAAYGSGDLTSTNIGQHQTNNYMTGYDFMSSNTPSTMSEVHMNNSMIHNLPSNGFNQMKSGGIASENIQNLQQIQGGTGYGTFATNQQNIGNSVIIQNDSNYGAMSGTSVQRNDNNPCQNPFEDTLEGNKDAKKGTGDPSSTSQSSITKV